MYRSATQRAPITFIQGEHSKIFSPRGSELTWRNSAEADGEGLHQRKASPTTRTWDLFIGKHAARDVYPYLVEQLRPTQPISLTA